MSALGQKQTFAAHKPMSALPLKPDMCSATTDVRYGPKAGIREMAYAQKDRRPQRPLSQIDHGSRCA